MTGIALLGAGIFAREEHLPAIEATPYLTLKAVYSRSQHSAETLAAASKDPSSVAIYFDNPTVPGKSLADLLQRADIGAVDVALPILQQPAVVEQALRAGKHVLSEKPVAGDIEGGKALIAKYEGLGEGKPLWGVAENWRYMESLRYAAERVREVGGELVTFKLHKYGSVKADNKYFNTAWRKTPEYQGGFLLDGGVHFVAGLRFLLEAAGQEIKQLVGFSGLLDEKLIPVDTVQAVALTGNRKSGTIIITFGTEFKSGTEVEVVTTKGAVSWNPVEVKTVTSKGEEKKEFPSSNGVTEEVAAFGEAINAGQINNLQSPQEALKDLEILQRLLESGAGEGAVKSVGLAMPSAIQGKQSVKAKLKFKPEPKNLTLRLLSSTLRVLCLSAVVYFLFLGLLTITLFQDHAIYLHGVTHTGSQDVTVAEQWGFLPNQVTPFTLETPDSITLHAWHILPLGIYDKHQDELASQSGLSGNITDRTSFKLLRDDPEALLVLYFHGAAGTLASGWRPQSYRAMSAAAPDKVHTVAIDYRGFGSSSGAPSERGLLTDAITVAEWAMQEAGIPPSSASSYSASLWELRLEYPSRATRSAVRTHPTLFAGLVLVAPFADVELLTSSYRIAGICEGMSGDGLKYHVTIIHAQDDYDIPWSHSDQLFWHAVNASRPNGIVFQDLEGEKAKGKKMLGPAEWVAEHRTKGLSGRRSLNGGYMTGSCHIRL
ncbi:hypothetical protein CHGG_09437 [Chaetomium globosum CBS 148.51]|uniref:AB hydrolase-1 domain-containing protein n=1 Tax=Chaetomium globosum (strain ATCC 6205 / CBS 148.51 / DSM 1962 / NBRC 6347 / NRRL 1970) TaxID=306901 RepID=Q2GRG7_CHAGB|nr:uncharacterized protein CHGG_09437 [Chaetomium globosum CBS 148.51]EAQ85423.1 hypothetical protein CHGG_09437 [Chaetomium globosum CBS 148.51]